MNQVEKKNPKLKYISCFKHLGNRAHIKKKVTTNSFPPSVSPCFLLSFLPSSTDHHRSQFAGKSVSQAQMPGLSQAILQFSSQQQRALEPLIWQTDHQQAGNCSSPARPRPPSPPTSGPTRVPSAGGIPSLPRKLPLLPLSPRCASSFQSTAYKSCSSVLACDLLFISPCFSDPEWLFSELFFLPYRSPFQPHLNVIQSEMVLR